MIQNRARIKRTRNRPKKDTGTARSMSRSLRRIPYNHPMERK